MTDLYRFYDASNRLLYIGISLSAAQRASQHRADKEWWPDVARMEVEHLGCSRRDAEAAERAAIIRERPIHNVVHNMPTRHPKAAPDSRIQWRCAICGEAIADKRGGLEIKSADLWRAEQAMAEQASGGLVRGGSVLDVPPLARWRAIHIDCDPNDDFAYWIEVERIRTLSQVDEWTRHLIRKEWVVATNWADFIANAKPRTTP